ncbi:MAG: TlpA family protein disulfide reductase [Omnitrophica WOR_2 bacterium]
MTIFAGLAIGAGLGVLILSMPAGFWPSFGRGQDQAGGPSGFSFTAGSAAPDFELKALTGNSIHLSDLKGHPVILNFWATWCVPCRQEMPLFESRYEKYPDQFQVLAINFNEPDSDVQAYVNDLGLTFPVLLDPGGNIQKLYRIRGYPTTYIIDVDGNIRAEHIGAVDASQLDNYLKMIGVGG